MGSIITEKQKHHLDQLAAFILFAYNLEIWIALPSFGLGKFCFPIYGFTRCTGGFSNITCKTHARSHL